jgi:hypothetical protein
MTRLRRELRCIVLLGFLSISLLINYMENLTNPAERLHVFLSSALVCDQNQSMLAVWTELFEITAPTEISVSRYVLGMADCLEDIKKQLSLRPNVNMNTYTKSFGSIEAVLSPCVLRHNGSQVLAPLLTAEVMTRLEFCAEELRRFDIEVELPIDELIAIRLEVEALIELITSSNIEDRLRLVLIEDLERMLFAVRLYRVQGMKALATVHRSILGAAEAHDKTITASSKDDKEILARLGRFLEKVEKSVSAVSKISAAISKPTRFLVSLLSRKILKNDDPVPSIEET